jgi:hypothetical protein
MESLKVVFVFCHGRRPTRRGAGAKQMTSNNPTQLPFYLLSFAAGASAALLVKEALSSWKGNRQGTEDDRKNGTFCVSPCTITLRTIAHGSFRLRLHRH